MKKIAVFFLILINFVLLSSCNTSRPSNYLSSKVAPKKSFFVEFDTNGGSKIERLMVEEGSLLSVPQAPTKEHADFNGWYTNEALTEAYDFGSIISGDLTLYASWIDYHLVKFVTLGGTEVEDQYIKDGYNLVAPTTKKEGFTFQGWYLDSNYENQFDFSSVITKDLFLYARWV